MVVVVVVVLIVVAVLVSSKTKAIGGQGAPPPYERKDEPLFTTAERSFLGVLDEVVAGRARVFGKIRVADVLTTRKGLEPKARTVAFNKISAKHFDFVLCNPADLSILAVLELDDSSHKKGKRQERDAFLEQACAAAGLPLLRMPAKKGYVLAEVAEWLAPVLPLALFPAPSSHPAVVATAASSPAPKNEAPAPAVALSKQAPLRTTPPAETVAEKICPKCSSTLVQRVARQGAHAGKRFWACSGYPTCKHIEPVAEVVV